MNSEICQFRSAEWVICLGMYKHLSSTVWFAYIPYKLEIENFDNYIIESELIQLRQFTDDILMKYSNWHQEVS